MDECVQYRATQCVLRPNNVEDACKSNVSAKAMITKFLPISEASLVQGDDAKMTSAYFFLPGVKTWIRTKDSERDLFRASICVRNMFNVFSYRVTHVNGSNPVLQVMGGNIVTQSLNGNYGIFCTIACTLNPLKMSSAPLNPALWIRIGYSIMCFN